MQLLPQNSRYLKSVSGSLLLISCYATWAAWGVGLLALLGFSMSSNPTIPFLDFIREPLFFAVLALFILFSLRQGMLTLSLAIIGALLLYIGHYVYPSNLLFLVGNVALLASYILGRKRNSELSLQKQKNII
jgi:hypothetical protein